MRKVLKFGWEFLTPLILYAFFSVVENIEGSDIGDVVKHLSLSVRKTFLHDFAVIFISLIVAFLLIETLLVNVRARRSENASATTIWTRRAHEVLEALALVLAVALGILSNEAVTLARDELHGSQWPEPQTRIALLSLLGLAILVFRLLLYIARAAHWFGINDHLILLERLQSEYNQFLDAPLMLQRQATILASQWHGGDGDARPYSGRNLRFDPNRTEECQALWLSASGGGKTAQLYSAGLRLTSGALQRLTTQSAFPGSGGASGASTITYIPFILDLSTWDTHETDFESWLITAIVSRYDVYKGMVNKLVKESGNVRALPLLDSLNALYELEGAKCLKAITAYLDSRRGPGESAPLVICCRTQDYERIHAINTTMLERIGPAAGHPQVPHRSPFQRTVIQPLDEQAIVAALSDSNLAFLIPDVRGDSRWWAFLKTPLHLSLLFLAAGASSLDAEEQKQLRAIVESQPSATLDLLIERYIQKDVASRHPTELSRALDIKKALVWMAHLLSEAAARPPLPQNSAAALNIAQSGAVDTTVSRTSRTSVAKASAWIKHHLEEAFSRPSIPHDAGEYGGHTLHLEHMQPNSLPDGDSSQRAYPRILFTMRNAFRVLVASVFGVGVAAYVTLVYYLDHGAVASLLFRQSQTELDTPVILGLFGLVSGLGVGYSLGAQINATDPIKLVDRVDYDQRHFWIFWLIGGGIALFLTLVIWLSIGSEMGLTTRTVDAVVLGLDGGAFAAVIMDLLARLKRSRAIEVSHRLRRYHWPGEGVRHSITAAVRVFAFYTILGILVGGLAMGLIMGILAGVGTLTLRIAVILAFAGALSGAVAGALGSATLIGINESLNAGGAAVLQHGALRMALNWSQVLPRRIPRLLEDANRMGLLNREGGGYTFSSQLLQEVFARQYQSIILDEIERKRQAASMRKRRSLKMRPPAPPKGANRWGRVFWRAPRSARSELDFIHSKE